MPKIYNWTAKRAGAHITLVGWEKRDGEAVGHEVKIAGIASIECASGEQPIATDKNGERYVLS